MAADNKGNEMSEQTTLETTTCSRCGGTGNYSFNIMHGSRCYGCGGAGKVYTRRGKAALAFLVALRSRKASEIEVGDTFLFDAFTSKFFLRVNEIIKRNDGTLELVGSHSGYRTAFIVGPDQVLRKGWSLEEKRDQFIKALAYQETLTQAGTPRKRAMKNAA